MPIGCRCPPRLLAADLEIGRQPSVAELIGALETQTFLDAAFEQRGIVLEAVQLVGKRSSASTAVDRALEQGSRRQVESRAGAVAPVRRRRRRRGRRAAGARGAPGWSHEEMLRGEKEALGLYLSGHPLERLRRRPQGGGRAHQRHARDGAGRGRRHHGRHRRRLPHRQDAQGRSHGGVHARGPDRQRRGRRYPEPYKQFASIIENDRMVVVTGASRSTRSGPRCAPPRSRT